ncbi:hypothetical protein B0H14DRAFT_2575138 [Mycena olivaceomarginata]|nr:hypothetical protein B0H14DRAFT_2575138 [Mycena olivaceomarginata]
MAHQMNLPRVVIALSALLTSSYLILLLAKVAPKPHAKNRIHILVPVTLTPLHREHCLPIPISMVISADVERAEGGAHNRRLRYTPRRARREIHEGAARCGNPASLGPEKAKPHPHLAKSIHTRVRPARVSPPTSTRGNDFPAASRWTCSVGGIGIPSSTLKFQENNLPLCNQPQTASGAHTLTIQVNPKGQPFYINHLEYHPLPEAFSPSPVLVYWYSDPALTYGAGWTEDDGISTQTAGSNVTLSFGPPNATIAHYTIDGGAPVTFQLTGQSGAQYNQVIFTTPGLPNGPHNLTVTHGSDINHTPLSVKYFFVTNTTTVASPVSSLIHGSFSRCTIAIVGGVSGGVFLLAVLGDIYAWYRRRQRRATGEASMFNPYPMSGSDTTRPFAQLSGPYATMGYFARTRKRDLGATGEVPRPSRAKRGDTVSPPVRTVRHEDSGLLLEDGARSAPEIVELPPGYTPL